MANDDDYDYLFKIIVIGEPGVGKSSLLRQFCSQAFDEKHRLTVGVDYQFHDINLTRGDQQIKVKLQLWDTAGEERYKALTSVYYRNAHAVIIVFDLTRTNTFKSVIVWLQNAQRHCGEVRVVLVGNKCDLESVVDFDDIEDFAYQHDLHFIETSAKTSTNIKETFYKLAEDLVEEENQLLSLRSLDSNPGSFLLHEANRQSQEGYCCYYI